MDAIAEAINKKQGSFSNVQEAIRKDIERLLGVLISRWPIIANQCH